MDRETASKARNTRNQRYRKSHVEMIETAVRLIADKGVEALTLAGLASELQINRSTIYYHFDSRESLVQEVKGWAAEQLSRGLDIQVSRKDRIDYITRFVLENPALINLWIEELVTGNEIERSYPVWQQFVESVDRAVNKSETSLDAEIFCLGLLVSAIITPHVFKRCIRPDQDIDQLVVRFRQERLRTLPRELLAQLADSES